MPREVVPSPRPHLLATHICCTSALYKFISTRIITVIRHYRRVVLQLFERVLLSQVTSVMTQGRGDGKEWLTSFTVSYSTVDVNQWQYVTDQYGNRKVSRSPMHHNYVHVGPLTFSV